MTAAPVVSGPRCRCGHVVLLHVMGRAACGEWGYIFRCRCEQYTELLAEAPKSSILGRLASEPTTDTTRAAEEG